MRLNRRRKVPLLDFFAKVDDRKMRKIRQTDSIDDIAFKNKSNAFWSVGVLNRDNQFVIFTTQLFFLWDFLLSNPLSIPQ